MESPELLALFRSEMNDTVKPYLWSDDELISYLDDAQLMFCRKTEGIPDDENPTVTRVDVAVGTDRINLHPTIKQIRNVIRTDTGRTIEVINKEDMPRRGWYFDGRSGHVRALVIGSTANRARVWPLSDEVLTLELSVFRLPLTKIADTDVLEIDEEHHVHLLHWVKHRAYLKQDSEAFDRLNAAECETKFLAYCAEVKTEQRRKRHKARTISYAGL
jgi:hypothetical protein